MKSTFLNIALFLLLLASIAGNIYTLYQLHLKSAEITALERKLDVFNRSYATNQLYKDKLAELNHREADLKLKEKSYEKSMENISRRGRIQDNRILSLPATELIREAAEWDRKLQDSSYQARYFGYNAANLLSEPGTGN